MGTIKIEKKKNYDRGSEPKIVKIRKIRYIKMKLALAKMKKNEVTGRDEISLEIMTDLNDFGRDKITKVIHEIYDSSEILDELRR